LEGSDKLFNIAAVDDRDGFNFGSFNFDDDKDGDSGEFEWDDDDAVVGAGRPHKRVFLKYLLSSNAPAADTDGSINVKHSNPTAPDATLQETPDLVTIVTIHAAPGNDADVVNALANAKM
jgi:hypothetical protein